MGNWALGYQALIVPVRVFLEVGVEEIEIRGHAFTDARQSRPTAMNVPMAACSVDNRCSKSCSTTAMAAASPVV